VLRYELIEKQNEVNLPYWTPQKKNVEKAGPSPILQKSLLRTEEASSVSGPLRLQILALGQVAQSFSLKVKLSPLATQQLDKYCDEPLSSTGIELENRRSCGVHTISSPIRFASIKRRII
jgi:hypothetical protein